MLAVSNTSPVSNLAYVGHLELLKAQFSTVWIQDAVAQELAAHPDPAARVGVQNALREKWLRIQAAQDSRLLRLLLLHVDCPIIRERLKVCRGSLVKKNQDNGVPAGSSS